MTFTSSRAFRPLNDLLDPSMFYSSFRGGPSSKKKFPELTVGGNATSMPVPSFSVNPSQYPSTRLSNTEQWKIERVVALGMLAIIPGSFVFDSPLMNYLLAASLVIHAYWGMDNVLLGYCPRKVLPLANIIRYALTGMAFLGLCYFNYHDMGLTKALKALWAMY